MPAPEDPATTIAVVVARLDDVRDDIAGLRRAIEASARDKVSRGEWEQRNNHVDSRLAGQGREIGDLRAEIAAARGEARHAVAAVRADLDSRRAPWWSTATVLTACAALAWSIFGDLLVGR